MTKRDDHPKSFDDVLEEHLRDPEFRAEWALLQPQTNLASNVFRLRTLRGLTQKELARAAGMRQPRIAEIERGDSNPRLETISRLAHALGTTPGALLAATTTADEENRAKVVQRIELPEEVYGLTHQVSSSGRSVPSLGRQKPAYHVTIVFSPEPTEPADSPYTAAIEPDQQSQEVSQFFQGYTRGKDSG